MPVGRHYGFIYNQYDNARTLAHELAHGALALSHTFADGSESYLGEQGTTANLMDYNGGTALNHIQWQWAHETHRNILGFLDDESEGENISLNSNFYALLNGNSPKRFYNKSEITIIKGDTINLKIYPSEFILKYAEQCYHKLHHDSLQIIIDSDKWIITDAEGNVQTNSNLDYGEYYYKTRIDTFMVRMFRDGKSYVPTPIKSPNENNGNELIIKVTIVDAPIVRIEPEDRDNFFLQFGYDDALVEENQKNGDYTSLSIGGYKYYVPWLNITQKCNAAMKLNINNGKQNSLTNKYYVVNGKYKTNTSNTIKINGCDSLIINSSNIEAAFTISSKEVGNDAFVYVMCCDSLTKQRTVAGCLQVSCRELKTIGSIRVIRTKRNNEKDYPQINPQEIVDNINKYYVQAGIKFDIDNKENYYKNVIISDTLSFKVGFVYDDEEYGSGTDSYRLYVVKKNAKVDIFGGESKTGKKCCFVFDGGSEATFAHEMGHSIILRHVFADNNNKNDGRAYHPLKHSTKNIMDYIVKDYDPRKLLYKYQILEIWNVLDKKQSNK